VFTPTLLTFQFNLEHESGAAYTQQIDSVQAGYAHTVILSQGRVFTVGLNIYGQLGLDHTKSRRAFELVKYDINRLLLPEIKQIYTGK